VCSGTIDTSASHHKAVFHIINSSLCSNAGPKQKYIQYYDYCASNVAKFTEALSNELNAQQPEEFDKFHTVFIKQLDQACKLEQPECSKRTAKNNTWITSGLIASVNKTHELKDIWIKAKTEKCLNIEDPKQFNCNCNNCTLTNKRHDEFKAYRKKKNHLINCAKLKYNGEKIKECAGDSKKTWEIVNNLRGKCRRQIKPNFKTRDR
jgi:hypothetical protein